MIEPPCPDCGSMNYKLVDFDYDWEINPYIIDYCYCPNCGTGFKISGKIVDIKVEEICL